MLLAPENGPEGLLFQRWGDPSAAPQTHPGLCISVSGACATVERTSLESPLGSGKRACASSLDCLVPVMGGMGLSPCMTLIPLGISCGLSPCILAPAPESAGQRPHASGDSSAWSGHLRVDSGICSRDMKSDSVRTVGGLVLAPSKLGCGIESRRWGSNFHPGGCCPRDPPLFSSLHPLWLGQGCGLGHVLVWKLLQSLS